MSPRWPLVPSAVSHTIPKSGVQWNWGTLEMPLMMSPLPHCHSGHFLLGSHWPETLWVLYKCRKMMILDPSVSIPLELGMISGNPSSDNSPRKHPTYPRLGTDHLSKVPREQWWSLSCLNSLECKFTKTVFPHPSRPAGSSSLWQWGSLLP